MNTYWNLPTPFSFDQREEIASKVCKKLRERGIEISVNYSHESGFELPLTQEWLDDLKFTNKSNCLKYHSSRQLRFNTDSESKRVVGLITKDSICYWTEAEVELVVNEIEICLKQIE